MDNCLASMSFFSKLRQEGYGAFSPTRTGKLPQLFQETKDLGKSEKMPLYEVYIISTDDVFCFDWKNSNIFYHCPLFIPTTKLRKELESSLLFLQQTARNSMKSLA